MSRDLDYFRALELPRWAALTPNLSAAVFPLMKLMPARYMLERATERGTLERGGHIVETTSGTFGLAVAMLAAVGQYQLTLIGTPTLIDPKFKGRLEQLGATVLLVDDPAGEGNQRGRLARLQAILESQPNSFWPRQYDNPDNLLAYARLAEMAVGLLGRVDCLVGPVGTGGSLCGAAHFLRKVFPELKVLAVDTHRSALFGQPLGKRLLRGLGNSIIPANVRHELVDQVHWVGALPAYASARRLFRSYGLFMGPTSGAAALVAMWFARMNPDAATVVIMPDEGHRYADTVYNDAWLSALDGWPAPLPEEPTRVDRICPAGEGDWTFYLWNRRTLSAVLALEGNSS